MTSPPGTREDARRTLLRAVGDVTPKQGSVVAWGERGEFICEPALIVPTVIITDDITASREFGLILCDTTSTQVDITLPPVAKMDWFRLIVKRITAGANNVVITPDGSETIDGDPSHTLSSQWESVAIVGVAENGHWYITG